VNVKRKKNRIVNAIDTAMKAGVVAAGAESKSRASEGRTSRSYAGLIEAGVQFTAAALLGRSQEPSAPRNTLGPSTPPPEPG